MTNPLSNGCCCITWLEGSDLFVIGVIGYAEDVVSSRSVSILLRSPLFIPKRNLSSPVFRFGEWVLERRHKCRPPRNKVRSCEYERRLLWLMLRIIFCQGLGLNEHNGDNTVSL